MSITYFDLTKHPEQNALNLTVEQNGFAITVKAGTFRVGSVDYALAEDETFIVTPHPTLKMGIEGLLVLNQLGEVHVLVDEILKDRIDRPFDFSSTQEYRLIVPLYDAYLEPNAQAFDVRVRRYLSPPAPPAPVVPPEIEERIRAMRRAAEEN